MTATPNVFQLNQLGLIAVQGPDSETFLQGQLTADTKTLAVGETVLSAHCNAKGRMQSNFHLYRADADTFLLQLPASMLEHAQQSLNKYAVFSKVAIKPLSNDLCAMASTGSHSALAEKALYAVKNFTQGDSQTNITYWLPKSHGLDLEISHNDNDWYAAMVQSGMAYVLPETVGEYIPQMFNMDALNGISFTKGCYTGQEIIARMKYLGSVKRRLYAFTIDAQSDAALLPIIPGTLVYNAEQKKVGEVVLSATDKNSSTLLGLAVLSTKERSEGLVVDGQAINLTELPYALDDEN